MNKNVNNTRVNNYSIFLIKLMISTLNQIKYPDLFVCLNEGKYYKYILDHYLINFIADSNLRNRILKTSTKQMSNFIYYYTY